MIMANYVPYDPTSTIGKALFNFDAFGISNFKYSGIVKISVSDAFTYSQYLVSLISSDVYTPFATDNVPRTELQLSNINAMTSMYSSFINLHFSQVTSYFGFNPSDVGSFSDINISFIYRPFLKFSGESALNTDSSFGYVASRGDIVINVNQIGFNGSASDTSLNSNSYGFHTLMHEIGHSIGLSHPHQKYENGAVTQLTSNYMALTNIGFDKLGFRINSAFDMNKEYFSIMSYDDQQIAGLPDTFAQTPMILDVIALQGAYGEGTGSTSSGSDVIMPGASGVVNAYRTYFDTGGWDTIQLINYASGAFLNMGTTISGAPHLVGVSMSIADKSLMANGGDPVSLRWFYGEYESASGSSASDYIIGNALNNAIDGGDGNDTLFGGDGNDVISGGYGFDFMDGGSGNDTVSFAFFVDSTGTTINLSSQLVTFSTYWSFGGQVEQIVNFENVIGGGGDDQIIGDYMNNFLEGGPGNDTIDGVGGIDTVLYSGSRASFVLTKTGSGFTAKDFIGSEGTDIFINVERLQFADKMLAIDLQPTGRAGQALEFIGLLAPVLINSPSVVGTILGLFDQGKSMHDVCQLALDVGLVNSIAGSNSNESLAAMAFRNLIGFEADAGTINGLLGYMDGRYANYSQADFMAVIAGLDLNQMHIGLVGLQQVGIEYV
jgi:hypothetical protein